MQIRTLLFNCAVVCMSAAIPVTVTAQLDIPYGGNLAAGEAHAHSTVWQEALERGLRRAIDPNDYICSNPTAIDFWLDEQFSQIDFFSFITLNALSVMFWSFDAKILVDHDARGEYIGVDGELTQSQFKAFKDNRRFWDINSDDILLMGGHGAIIADDQMMDSFFNIVFGWASDEERQIILTAARNVIEGGLVDLDYFEPGFVFEAPGLHGGYGNPLLSLNALAFTSWGQEIFPGSGIIPDKIVMGDGLIEAFRGIGLGARESSDFILAHEFGHHVQFEIGAFEPGPPAAEKTRRTELMADGFAAYHSSHARGNTFQAKRFVDVMTAAYEVGDCAFGSFGHHGTHLQRLNATLWGQMMTDDARDQGHIYSSVSMMEMFDEALPALVAPDAP